MAIDKESEKAQIFETRADKRSVYIYMYARNLDRGGKAIDGREFINDLKCGGPPWNLPRLSGFHFGGRARPAAGSGPETTYTSDLLRVVLYHHFKWFV